MDGSIHTFWVENLNTVMDDSKVLCLSNGERLKLDSSIRFIFETDELSSVTPATVSRFGIIYLDIDTINRKDLVDAYFKTFP